MLSNKAENAPRKTKRWFALTCPVCGFRFPPKKFNLTMKEILYPAAVISGGGRAKGFHVEQYVSWESLPKLRQFEIWNNLQCMYTRLGCAYDHFYRILGFLSPEIRRLVQQLQGGYTSAYLTSLFHEYSTSYGPIDKFDKVAEAYPADDYPTAYARSFSRSDLDGGEQHE